MNKIFALSLILITSSVLATPLSDAIYNSDEAAVRGLLAASPASVNQECNEEHWYPLHVAAFYGRDAIAGILIEHGALVDQEKSRDVVRMRTPLGIAVNAIHGEVAARLIRAGARYDIEIDMLSRRRIDLFRLAAFYGLTVAVDAFLEREHPISADAVHEAADWGDPVLLQTLINHGGLVEIARIGKCNRNLRWYLGVLPTLLNGVQELTVQEQEIIEANINQNSGWNAAQKNEMIQMVYRHGINR